MRPTRIALPLLAAGFLFAPDAARAQSRRAQLQTGLELIQKGRESDALAVFRKLTEQDPGFLEAWNNRAALEASKGDLEAANASLERALESHSDVSLITNNLKKVRSRLAHLAYDSAFGTPSSLPPLLLELQRDPLSFPTDSAAIRQRDSLAQIVSQLQTSYKRELERKDSLAGSQTAEMTRLRSALDKALAAAESAKARIALAEATPAKSDEPSSPAVRKPASGPVVTTVASAPAVRPETPPAPTSAKQPETPEGVVAALQAWARAWSAQDIDQYLACYSSRFVPSGNLSRADWESYRKERVQAPKSIQVEISSAKARMLKEHHAEVDFRQVYQTEATRLTSRKRLEFAWEHGVWKIFAEKEAR